MKEDRLEIDIDIPKIRKWLSCINPNFLAVRPPEVFEKIGFSQDLVLLCVRTYPHLRLNNGNFGEGRGVSDGIMLRIMAEAIEANYFKGDAKLCKSNQVDAWRDACFARLDEIEREETEELTDDIKSK